MAHFVIAVQALEYYPQHNLFECCLIGRSNVGKSSLINALANAKIAYISKTPGRTQTVNFYDFQRFYLVDLPGYGYAKVPQVKKNQLVAIAENYLYFREQLMSVVHVCDINVITDLDIAMQQHLSAKFHNYLLCLNKADKLSNQQQKQQKQLIQKQLGLADHQVLVISAKKHTNIKQLLGIITHWTQKK